MVERGSITADDCDAPGCFGGVAAVRYTADPGEVNRPKITAGPGESTVTVRDPGAMIRAGRGCTVVSVSEARCSASRVGRALFDLGDMDDRATLVTGVVRGGPGEDRIKAAHAEGGSGDDVVLGTRFEDFLDGGRGADVVRGAGAPDLLVDGDAGGKPSSDRLDGGGSSLDVIDYADRAEGVVVLLEAGRGGRRGEGDQLRGIESATGGSGPDRLVAGGRFAELVGGPGDDRLIGGPAGDFIYGEAGDDRIFGRGGNDLVSGDTFAVDEFQEEPFPVGRDVLHGGPGDDELEGDGGADRLSGGFGDDKLYGPDHESLERRDRGDRLAGGPGHDALFGFLGNDRLTGGPGRDTLDGSAGTDVFLTRDRSRDRLDGGRGRDVAYLDPGLDRTRRVELRRSRRAR
jgi:Ca2+-binding RTX toxin-like protein